MKEQLGDKKQKKEQHTIIPKKGITFIHYIIIKETKMSNINKMKLRTNMTRKNAIS
jgi:hypothetical protein